ncbi:hypothetical protein [Jatrophihabitans endophyticus]|uniref:hypothetical protein n=1 Tax=Jatrophihabitans endophyticus TaxID=1206085 RepID=UPI0019FC0CA6|nr:hypothetical protein [Jatrophihabitans endophyticus]MBE7188295.1 hypothetical protein [Jatrophihabitans endophyticus]
MNRSTHTLVALATVTAAFVVTVVAGLTGTASAASSGPLPADPAAKGYVGLCDEAGRNVTGGSISTRPFVWKAVATTAPPTSYQGHGQNAVLGILQPRPGTAPAEWNGTSLTAASYYRQKATPAAQATYGDASLQSIIKRYPPEVDGLYVLRMYFGRAGYGNYTADYPTTTIQVTGKSWRVVRGGTVNCHAATAVSNEQLTGVVGRRSTTPRQPASSDHTVDTTRARVIAVSTADIEAKGGPHSIDAAPAADSSQSSNSTVVWVLVGVVVLLVIALGAVVRTRRTGSSGS